MMHFGNGDKPNWNQQICWDLAFTVPTCGASEVNNVVGTPRLAKIDYKSETTVLKKLQSCC